LNVKEVHNAADKILSEFCNDKNISCGKSFPCNGCCTQPIYCYEDEVVLAVEAGIDSGFITKTKLVEILKSAYERTKWGEIKRRKEGKYCVFFNHEKQNCGVYPARPLVCRSYLMKDIGAVECHKARGRVHQRYAAKDIRLYTLFGKLLVNEGPPRTLDQHLINARNKLYGKV
jgi:Fe-S-cluster containining protein